MIVAIIGSRSFIDYELLKENLSGFKISKMVSGGAKGADSLGERYALENGIPILIFKPDWKKYGRGAGIVRNRQIVEAADFVIAFWDGTSKGTQSAIEISKKAGKGVRVISF